MKQNPKLIQTPKLTKIQSCTKNQNHKPKSFGVRFGISACLIDPRSILLEFIFVINVYQLHEKHFRWKVRKDMYLKSDYA